MANSLAQLLGIRKPALITPSKFAGQSPNDAAELYETQSALQDDLTGRIFQEERLGAEHQNPNELKALKNLFMTRQNEMRQGTVGQQQPIVAAQMAGQADAVNAGFGGTNPMAEQAVYGRQIAEEKMRQPMAQERLKGDYGVQEARINAQGQVDTARQYGQNQQDVQRLINENSQNYIRGGNPRAFNPRTGAVGAEPQSRIGNTQLNPLMRDYTNKLQGLRGADIFDVNMAQRPGVREARQAWANILNQYPADADIKNEAMEFLNHPTARNLAFEQAYSPEDFAQNPEDYEILRDIISLARGGQ